MLFDEERRWNWNIAKAKEDESFEIELRLLKGSEYHPGDHAIGKKANSKEDTDGEEHADDNKKEEEQLHPRRSTRVSFKPSYLDDYVLLAQAECERLLMVINNEPYDFNEAKELKVWIDACIDEIASIEKNNNWVLIDLLRGFKSIGLK